MRWLYADKNNPEESQRITETEERFQKWWKAFTDKQAEIGMLLKGETQFDLGAWMAEHLQIINDKFLWEFRAGKTAPYCLVISCQGNKELAPMIALMLKMAPELEEWEFHPYMSGQSFDKSDLFVQEKTGVAIKDIDFQASPGSNNLINLTFTTTDDKTKEAVLMAAQMILGEEAVTNWLGEIKFIDPPKNILGFIKRAHKGFHGIEDLKLEFHEHVQDIQEETVPESLYFELEQSTNFDSSGWSVFKGEPKEGQENYPGQSDLAVGISCCPEIFQATHTAIPFSSNRFSKFDEQFCYLKIDGNDSLENCSFADRKELEEALHKTLIAREAGCVIGGGTGLKYSYVELVIADIDKAIPEIKKMLTDAKISNKTWMLFHDANMLNEWIGIYDDTPAPPM